MLLLIAQCTKYNVRCRMCQTTSKRVLDAYNILLEFSLIIVAISCSVAILILESKSNRQLLDWIHFSRLM